MLSGGGLEFTKLFCMATVLNQLPSVIATRMRSYDDIPVKDSRGVV